jgi:rhodanese-related sulfurtransferase
MYLDETSVTAERAIELVESGQVWLLDVRERFEWDEGHIRAAHLIPLGELESRQQEIPEDQQILVVCHVGGRSQLVTEALLRADYPAANILGGMDAWKQSGGSVVSPDETEGRTA